MSPGSLSGNCSIQKDISPYRNLRIHKEHHRLVPVAFSPLMCVEVIQTLYQSLKSSNFLTMTFLVF
jgi:hypothetical protein